MAQFIYLLQNNPRIREVIDTITSKVVLLLGRFTPKRKVVLDTIRERLRTKNYSPVVFDFKKPITQNFTETVMTLVGMAKFVIADLTDSKRIPHELMSFVEKDPIRIQSSHHCSFPRCRSMQCLSTCNGTPG